MSITLRKARTIIRKALEAGRAAEMKPLSVVVLDAGGHIIAFEREDGASPGRFAIAHSDCLAKLELNLYRKLFGQIMLRHICATGVPSKPNPSFG